MAFVEGKVRSRKNQDVPPTEGLNETPKEDEKREKHQVVPTILPDTYWLTRIVLLRSLAFTYFVAFLVALHQNTGLLGKDGLLPANNYLNDVKKHTHGKILDMLQYVPSVLWFIDYEQDIDLYMQYISYGGLALSGFVLLTGAANMVLMLAIWLLYHSIVNVGQRWYSFGWESQLLETGFLAVFLCPLISLKAVPKGTPTSLIVILGFRWLIFRIMIGAGLIKIRGDQCWRDLTCMNYHYETQPVPNPMAYYMHQSPEIFHKFETLTNHFVELIGPFFIILTRRCRLVGGVVQILFQATLIVSGNLSFLNWLTMIPSIACFDDRSLSWMFSNKRNSVKWQVWAMQEEEKTGTVKQKSWGNYMRRCFNISFGILIVYLSVPIVQNLMSTRQIMNTSFDPLRIVNTYGAFGSITKERTEVIFQGTDSADPHDPSAKWLEYEFKCKPGNITRRPCVISPYHYRLDWLMWFAAFQSYQHNPWLVHLASKFLVNDEETLSLISNNPFQDGPPPRWVRAEHYKYVYTKIGSKAAKEGKWWKRSKKGNYLPPVSLESLKEVLKNMGWKVPQLQPMHKKNKKKARS